jgi:hypothetical protein
MIPLLEKTLKKRCKEKSADDKSWKELAAEAAVERYEKKSKNQVPSKLTEEQIRLLRKNIS